MEILYLYIKKYKAIEDQEFNFSLDYNFSFKKNEELYVDKVENHLGDNFFHPKISQFNAIIGKNGKGKSTLLEVLRLILSGNHKRLKTTFIIAFKLYGHQLDGIEDQICIEHSGLRTPSIFSQLDSHPSFREVNILDQPNHNSFVNHKVIYYSNFFDGVTSLDYQGIDLSTNEMARINSNNSVGIGSYAFEELQRTITYFASSPKYIDKEDFNVPNFISLAINKDYDLFVQFPKDQTDEVDDIIEKIKNKIIEDPGNF